MTRRDACSLVNSFLNIAHPTSPSLDLPRLPAYHRRLRLQSSEVHIDEYMCTCILLKMYGVMWVQVRKYYRIKKMKPLIEYILVYSYTW